MVESMGPTVVEDEKARALNNYRKKIVDCRDMETRLKELRKKVIFLLICLTL